MKFIELKKRLAQGKDACYLLSGDDPFIISSAVKTFEKYVELPDMNLVHLTAPTASEIVAAAVVFPMMSPIRLVVVEGFTSDAAALKTYLSNPSPETVILIISPVPTKNLSDIVHDVTIVDCSKQTEDVITQYIARECGANGVNITVPAAKQLIASCSRSMTRISTELVKLMAYKKGGTIESADVSTLVCADNEYKVYELGDKIAARQGEKALMILSDMMMDSTAMTFGVIYAHFRKLLYVVISPESEVKTAFGMSDYVYGKLMAQARGYSPKRLKRICDMLHSVDSDYKAGLISDKLAIEMFTMNVINEGK